MPHNRKLSNGHCCKQRSGFDELLVCALFLSCISFAIPSAASAATTFLSINPATGDDSQCFESASISCKTIARAVQFHGISFLILSAGIYNEPTIGISNMVSLSITGVANATVFDCSRRQGASSGAAFNITNSTIVITGVAFKNCINPTSYGGAISANGSSIAVAQCSFTDCSAASGGAISVTGYGTGTFISIQNSTFTRNRATGGLLGCPDDLSHPCSSWGGAIAAFEMYNVTISDCKMSENNARAFLPPSSSLIRRESNNSLSGGGCVSVLFRGNASSSAVFISGNTFEGCTVDVSEADNIVVGNGVYLQCKNWHLMFMCVTAVQGTEEQYLSTSVSRLDCSCYTCLFSTCTCKVTYLPIVWSL